MQSDQYHFLQNAKFNFSLTLYDVRLTKNEVPHLSDTDHLLDNNDIWSTNHRIRCQVSSSTSPPVPFSILEVYFEISKKEEARGTDSTFNVT
jgi:hypothetical protein